LLFGVLCALGFGLVPACYTTSKVHAAGGCFGGCFGGKTVHMPMPQPGTGPVNLQNRGVLPQGLRFPVEISQGGAEAGSNKNKCNKRKDVP
jgi:hypothetical protein